MSDGLGLVELADIGDDWFYELSMEIGSRLEFPWLVALLNPDFTSHAVGVFETKEDAAKAAQAHYENEAEAIIKHYDDNWEPSSADF